MAHYIAELINAAETAASEDDRRISEGAAAQAITDLWSQRTKFENRINPFNDLAPVILVLKTLSRENNYWSGRNPNAARIYDTLRRLVICLVLREASSADQFKTGLQTAERTAEHQAPDEVALMTLLKMLVPDLGARLGPEAHKEPQTGDEEEKVDLNANAVALIDHALEALGDLRSTIDKEIERSAALEETKMPPAKSAARKRSTVKTLPPVQRAN
jgi:hypothetical protein